MSEFKKVPVRNIWLAVFDIRPKNVMSTSVDRILDLGLPSRPPTIDKSIPSLSPKKKWLSLKFLVLMIIAASFYLGFRGVENFILSKKERVLAAVGGVMTEMAEGESAMRSFSFPEAQTHFKKAEDIIHSLKRELGVGYSIALKLTSVGTFEDLVSRSARIANLMNNIQEGLSKTVFSGSGEAKLIVKDIDRELTGMIEDLEKLGPSDKFSQKIPVILAELKSKRTELDIFRQILALEGRRTYLLLFQNPAEIRATGGFIGSYGTMKLENGRIIEFAVDDIYNPDGQLKIKVLPPRPLLKITSSWGGRDANWFFDFANSAKKVSWFLEKTTNVEPDGIISLNPSVIEKILTFTGPIDMPEYQKTVTSENFWEETQIQTRTGADRAKGQPKRFLTILGPKLLAKIKEIPAEKWPELAKHMAQALNEKEMQLYFRDSKIQAFIESKGWGGRVRGVPDKDYLAVVHTNIGGGKADYVTAQEIELLTEIEHDGGILNTLTLRRSHAGKNEKYWWWRARNYDYVRIYVPQGSELLESSGFRPEPKLLNVDRDRYDEIHEDIGLLANVRPILADSTKHVEILEESGKTVFAGWLVIDPGESASLNIQYRLPFPTGYASPGYALITQKQSGIRNKFTHRIVLPEGTKIIKTSGGYNAETSGWNYDYLKSDLMHTLEFLFPKPKY